MSRILKQQLGRKPVIIHYSEQPSGLMVGFTLYINGKRYGQNIRNLNYRALRLNEFDAALAKYIRDVIRIVRRKEIEDKTRYDEIIDILKEEYIALAPKYEEYLIREVKEFVWQL